MIVTARLCEKIISKVKIPKVASPSQTAENGIKLFFFILNLLRIIISQKPLKSDLLKDASPSFMIDFF